MATATLTKPEALPRRPPTQEEIEQLLLEEYVRRRSVRKKADCFLDFILALRQDFIVEEVHIAIAEQLERVVAGEIDRLQIFVAPRTGKSLMTSVLFPAYYIGKFPDRQIIQIGHSTNLAESFGRETRNLLNDEAYGQMFPNTELSKDSRSTGSWATTENGKYLAAGIGTGISGRGFHLCVHANTKLETVAGVRCAATVEVGDLVFGDTGWGRVEKKWLTIHDDEVKLNRKLTCSREHPIYEVTRGWVDAGQLKVGDRVKTLTLWRKLCIRLRRVAMQLGKV